MTWFESLTGVHETSPRLVRANLVVDGVKLRSLTNGKVYTCGRLETPSLAELRERVLSCDCPVEETSLTEVVADVQALHADVVNAGSLFQVASQFNLLEMISPSVTPECGVGVYENDHTQGPACAIAAGAGTIYRNYFAVVNGQLGQSASNQIDCLADLGRALGNSDSRLWVMRNGYALASAAGLAEISSRLHTSSEDETNRMRQLLRIGVQWNTQVTIKSSEHTVTQAYCLALPVAYSGHSVVLWESFARLILEAAYEATMCAAVVNSVSTGNRRVFLTLLGGGAFGNATEWIMAAISRALRIYKHCGLQVAIVSYGVSKSYVRQLVDHFRR